MTGPPCISVATKVASALLTVGAVAGAWVFVSFAYTAEVNRVATSATSTSFPLSSSPFLAAPLFVSFIRPHYGSVKTLFLFFASVALIDAQYLPTFVILGKV